MKLCVPPTAYTYRVQKYVCYGFKLRKVCFTIIAYWEMKIWSSLRDMCICIEVMANFVFL